MDGPIKFMTARGSSSAFTARQRERDSRRLGDSKHTGWGKRCPMTSLYYSHIYIYISFNRLQNKGDAWGFEMEAAVVCQCDAATVSKCWTFISSGERGTQRAPTTYAHAEEHTHTHTHTAPSVSATHTQQSRNPFKASGRPWKGALKSTSVIQRRRVAIATPVTWYLSAQEWWWWGTYCEDGCSKGIKDKLMAVFSPNVVLPSEINRLHWQHWPQKMITWDGQTEFILYILGIL